MEKEDSNTVKSAFEPSFIAISEFYRTAIIKNVLEDGELNEAATVAFFATVQNEGDRKVERMIAFSPR
ncbi:MAG: hypothetical protein PUE90_00065 [Bacteroidales bacterium]|nr:hypothetical protein [Bacteroidales bacterium]